MKSNHLPVIAVLLAAVGLAACTNDGGIIGGDRTAPVTRVEGIWSGGFLDIGGGGSVTGFIHDGQITLFQGAAFPSGQPDAFYFGTYNEQRQGVLTRYEGQGPVGNDANIQISLATTLNIQVGSTTSLMALQPIGDLYNRTATSDMLSGVWGMRLANYTLTLAYDPVNGTLVGSDTEGCNYNGRVEIPDPLHNIYLIEDLVLSESNIGACNGTGDITFAGPEPYSGMLAFIDLDPATNNIAWVLVSNETRAFMLELRRAS